MKHRSTRRSLGIIWLGTTLALVLTLWSGQVQAVDKYWNGSTRLAIGIPTPTGIPQEYRQTTIMSI